MHSSPKTLTIGLVLAVLKVMRRCGPLKSGKSVASGLWRNGFLMVAALGLTVACGDSPPGTVVPDDFNDHTVTQIEDTETFFALSAHAVGRRPLRNGLAHLAHAGDAARVAGATCPLRSRPRGSTRTCRA